MPTFLDTNILVYAVDEGEDTKRELALGLVEEHLVVGDGMISVQVIREFYAASRRMQNPLSHEEAAAAIAEFANFRVVSEDPQMVVRAAKRVGDGFSFRDALIVEAALRGGANRLFSEDMQNGPVISGMRIENPFK